MSKKNGLVVLRAEAISENTIKGTTCPDCGGYKSRGAGTCIKCYKKAGYDNAVKSIVRKIDTAHADVKSGHDLAAKGGVTRESITPLVLAQIKIPQTAKFTKAAIFSKNYLKLVSGVKGGVVEGFAFGIKNDDVKGTVVTALIEVREKVRNNITYPYFRAHIVPGVRSTVKFIVRNTGETDGLREDLPIVNQTYNIGNSILRPCFGFVDDPKVRAQ
jgi:hypothetical protein